MNEFDAVTAAIEGGITVRDDLEVLVGVILRALVVPGGDHSHAKNLPQMLKVTRRMRKGGAGSQEWDDGVSELRRLWGFE